MCFWWDEKIPFGHKCANRRLYSLTVELTGEEDEPLEPKILEEEEEEEATLSLHDLHDIEIATKNQTMKLVRYVKKRRLNILIDSGSTHNFCDLSVAKQVGCSIQKTAN